MSPDPTGRDAAAAAAEGQATATRHVSVPEDDGPELVVESDPAFQGEPVVLAAGDEFAGLLVRGKLGSGGMATVYRARDPGLDTDVALKLLDRGLVRDARHLQRFRREAALAARLRHPRIVSIHAYGEALGCAYLTMQLVEGPSLAEVVEREGPLEPWRAARIVEQAARAIDAAHRQRVVHRDLKPSNVMLHPEDGPLVLDFGLAKDLGRGVDLTETGEVLGTPAYLAPEQVSPEGHPVDHRIDVYGLGAILFFLLTGQHPHPGESALEVIQHLLRHDPPRLRAVVPALPRALEQVCAKALARDPDDRYQTAADLADDLSRYLARREVLARLPGRLRRLARLARRHPVTSALALALAALLLAGGLVVRDLTARVAREERAARGQALLERALARARASDPERADQELLQALRATRGALQEDPEHAGLRAARARVHRERAEVAEARGNWALAEELRQGLSRLAGDEEPPPAPAGAARISVEGLSAGEGVSFYAWRDERCERVAVARGPGAEVSLPPGAYVAACAGSAQRPAVHYLVVVDAGHRHVLRVGMASPPPPGVYRLPSRAALEQALPGLGLEGGS
ncbi:MAG: serine/threonine-protein kinase [Planctomycetota bacterium]